MQSILIVDDTLEILAADKSQFLDKGFNVSVADTWVKAILALSENKFDCIILDITLPDIDGFKICKTARKTANTPILFISCLNTIDGKIKALITEADSFMTKPYSLEDLFARVNALLGRGQQEELPASSEKVYVDKENQIIHTPEKDIFLSQKELELFMLLFENKNSVFSKEEIFKKLWPNVTDAGTVAVHISKLRRKLASVTGYVGTIKNKYKNGYYIKRP